MPVREYRSQLSSSLRRLGQREYQGRTMRKLISIAGILLFAALLFVQPSKADSFDTYTLTAGSTVISFTLPATITPSSVTWDGIINLTNVKATYDGGAYTFATVQLGATVYMGASNYAATWYLTKSIELIALGPFTWNVEVTLTRHSRVFNL